MTNQAGIEMGEGDDLQSVKAALRKRLRLDLSRVSPAEMAAASVQLCARLRQQRVWQEARRVLFFASQPAELDVWPLLEETLTAGYTVALPRFRPATRDYSIAAITDRSRDLTPGQLGILEPAPHCAEFPLNRLDLVLVPGLGFDWNGGRLGRGKGYYDRLLAPVRGVLCGVAMDRQVLPAIPAEPHDVALDCLVTPTRWFSIRPRAV